MTKASTARKTKRISKADIAAQQAETMKAYVNATIQTVVRTCEQYASISVPGPLLEQGLIALHSALVRVKETQQAEDFTAELDAIVAAYKAGEAVTQADGTSEG
jgi:hypothetical protein